jgi:hypothetical protein
VKLSTLARRLECCGLTQLSPYVALQSGVKPPRSKDSLAVNPLPDLLSAKRADTIEAKRKNDAMFVAQPDIESVKLCRDRATPPGMPNGRRGADE